MDGQDAEDCVKAAVAERQCFGTPLNCGSGAAGTLCDHDARRLDGDHHLRPWLI
jgi:hypothetical protein